MNDYGFAVVGQYNRTTEKVDHFLANRLASGTAVIGAHSIADMASKLKKTALRDDARQGREACGSNSSSNWCPCSSPATSSLTAAIPCSEDTNRAV